MVRQTLATLFRGSATTSTRCRKRKIVHPLDLRDDAAPSLRAMIDQMRIEMVTGAKPLSLTTSAFNA